MLYHAIEGPVFGPAMTKELGRHGYDISEGTLYSLLNRMEKKGYLRSKREHNGKSFRKVFRGTPLGRRALKTAKAKVQVLFGELTEGH
jgi:PadR family transcriptional regulator PadR